MSTLVLRAAMIALLVAPWCNVSATATKSTPAHATGSLVFTPDSDVAVEGFLRGEAEIGYSVRNEGKQPVKIVSVTPKSRDGKASAVPDSIGPNQVARLTLRREITELGVKEYGFRIRTDDPLRRDYLVNGKIFGMSAYTPDLPAVIFDVVRAGRRAMQRVTITSYETPVLDIKAILESPPWLVVRGVPRAADDRATQDLVLQVEIRDDAPRGVLQGEIHLLTTAAAQPDLVIPVQARVFGDISATPYPATFTPSHSGDVRELELEYRSLDGKALILKDIVDSRALLDFSPMACGSNCVKVKVRLEAPKPALIKGVIRARFDNRADDMLVAWDALVVSGTTRIRDLGVIGDDGARLKGTTGESRGGGK